MKAGTRIVCECAQLGHFGILFISDINTRTPGHHNNLIISSECYMLRENVIQLLSVWDGLIVIRVQLIKGAIKPRTTVSDEINVTGWLILMRGT